jgi:hypothetical protein
MVLLTSVTLSTPRGRATIIVRRHEEELWAPFGVGIKISSFSFSFRISHLRGMQALLSCIPIIKEKRKRKSFLVTGAAKSRWGANAFSSHLPDRDEHLAG